MAPPSLPKDLFLSTNDLADYLDIECILLGGSAIYSSMADADNTTAFKDWDGVIIVRRKRDIATLVNRNRGSLCSVLALVEEEYPNLKVPDPTHPLWTRFDGVRFVGWTANRRKKGVKILSLEYFLEGKCSLDLLSFKDKRVFLTSLGDRGCYTIIQQGTMVDNNLVILHEQTVYVGHTTRKCSHNQLHTSAVFGVTANLLLTATCVYGKCDVSTFIKKHLLAQFVSVSGTAPSVESLPQFRRFRPAYTQMLREEFATLSPDDCCESSFLPPDDYYYGAASLPGSVELYPLVSNSEPSSLQHKRRPSEMGDLACYERLTLHSPFSSNSSHGILKNNDKTSTLPQLFWKQCGHADAEIHGATLARKYYLAIQIPQRVVSGELFYDWFQGTTEADLRLQYLTCKPEHTEYLELILYAELRKAEDTLRAWTLSLRKERQLSSPNIHKFFLDRLRSRRIEDFYASGVQISGKRIPFSTFSEAPLVINDVAYPSLTVLLADAEAILSAKSETGLLVFGLGDGHGGNVMIGSQTLKNSSRPILHIDYEVAGFHSVILDIAKPLYNDVFFNIFYGDLLSDQREISISFDENSGVKINVDLRLDSLSRAIMEIKRRYLFEPVCRLAKEDMVDLYSVDSMRILRCALFCCALLSRDFSDKWDVFFTNLAVGVCLSQFTTLKDLEDHVLESNNE